MMGPMNGGGLIGLLLVAVLVVVPFWKLLPRFGMPGWLALAALVPLGAVVLLWVMAFRDDVSARRG
ncbi:hypothetical protein [Rhodosalinus sp. 5P4]|uniref:hypothetical protein n=1 Tax=Rhodosalinus sp. 5P4 TaxID=3239196 RepID=UPI003524DDBE